MNIAATIEHQYIDTITARESYKDIMDARYIDRAINASMIQ
jgi:hypothetical protein